MTVAYLVFELGNLQVYTMQNPSYIGQAPAWTPDHPTDNYYWRDPASPQGYGPFKNIAACMEHYKWVIYTCQGQQKQIEGKTVTEVAEVIRMDFKTKKRVDPGVQS